MSAVMILQARATSTRLPGKVLKQVGGRSILEWVVRGSTQVEGIDEVCVAIPEGAAHDDVAQEAERLRTTVVRGPEDDVLERFCIGARATGAKYVMRVTTDCPMMDPTICGQILRLLMTTGADYACNNQPFSYPHGLDCEFFTAETLFLARERATEPYDREHVTPWIRRASEVLRVYLQGPGDERIKWRWTVDTPDDLRFFEAVQTELGDKVSDWLAVSNLLQEKPEILSINFTSRQR